MPHLKNMVFRDCTYIGVARYLHYLARWQMKFEITTKRVAWFIGFLGFALQANAQSDTVTYWKDDGTQVGMPDSADYIRRISPPQAGDALPQLAEYYLNEQPRRKGDVLEMKGYPRFHGNVVEYYENGQKQSEEEFDKGVRVGAATYYYQNGQVKKEMRYAPRGERHGIERHMQQLDTLVNYYDSLGTKQVDQGNGFVREALGADYEEGAYRNGLRNGEWVGTFQKQCYTFTEQYHEGVVTSGESKDEEGHTFTYTAIATNPEYPGGMNSLMQFIGGNYRYPRKALDAGVKGTVMLRFVVERDGRVTEIEVTQDLGHGTGAEGARVLRMAPKWTPGYQRGVPVRVLYTLPIRLNFQ